VPYQWPNCEFSELRRILRRIVCRRGSNHSSSLLSTPLITLILHASLLRCQPTPKGCRFESYLRPNGPIPRPNSQTMSADSPIGKNSDCCLPTRDRWINFKEHFGVLGWSRTCPISRLYSNMPKTYIDLNRDRLALMHVGNS
jgi:hypothetical protein